MHEPTMALSRLGAAAAALAVVLSLSGCAATQVAISKRDLDVQTKMSATIFLDPVKPEQRTVYVQVRNTSDQQAMDLQPDIAAGVAGRGYAVVDDPDQAHYILQANVLYVGKSDPTANALSLHNGYGGAAGGALAALGAGYAMGGGGRAMVAGGLLGGITDSVTGAFVKDVYYTITTDIQIKERFAQPGAQAAMATEHDLQQGTSGGTQVTYTEMSDWKTYQTRIVSVANKMNLEFHEAVPALRQGLSQSLAGLF